MYTKFFILNIGTATNKCLVKLLCTFETCMGNKWSEILTINSKQEIKK